MPDDAQKPRRIHPGVAALFVILILIAGGCFAVGCHLKQKAEVVKSWTTVDAVITTSKTVTIAGKNPTTGAYQPFEQPQIGFRYTVDGQTFDSSRYDGNDTVPPHGALAKYPEGAQVRAYYDPANPKDAVLTNDVTLVFAIFFFVFGTFVLLPVGLIAYFVLASRGPPVAPVPPASV